MAIPLHLWLKDEDGTDIRGSSSVAGRVGSIEVLSLTHGLHLQADMTTGKLMAGRTHRPLTIEKEVDRSTPLLYRAVAKGTTLREAVIRWYRINEAGQEVEYFTTRMRNVKVVSVTPVVPNVRHREYLTVNHNETVDLRYEEITWSYLDGNITFKDAWSES
ncbi:type VI secretion system tube protein Hcp [bacterium M00.F.Ca.ET.228.01.1.1]|uniref:Hcp family type VI secretion system effector n=1 Tax=Paraburkholderia phenoliruptrix TaxID=252970 RepID=UPI001092EB8A|nr:type VI secretion system tube protein TssD [Paraburkholderia phenoliruptrix]TGP47885.1 type VI secretion system tube protein Hcp [bacterium M00.F.Ca.ET.228.01.1.1]TGS05678.1 type VI secretion system tube protein Hcp [bacterium M00.F.Ca.ET.191.01.1.1]TGU10614.1 type VI secretion system tube protein Hcp [bacterium M00.F.Ca.ET.155.01.1.1]MBW0445310.1 type VI secretion system tube protein Hcp [Paraburkholderia phenoliruptrix]MBW9096075.1 type VI secretion system tube protein Hcp [Paraburkholder